jgi:DNA-binding XRE family transcriptional regulator
MNKLTDVQIIHGPDGKPAYAVIPYAQYQQQLQLIDGDLTPQAVVKKIFIEKMSPARAWREHLGMTQQMVAERLGISQPAYAQQENSDRLRKSTRVKIAAALGIAHDLLDV